MNMMPKPGIEPATFRFSVWRSPNWAISAYLWLIFTLKLLSLQKTQTLRKSGNWILEPIHKRLYCIYGKFLRHRGISSNGRARASHERGSGINARILHVFLRKYFYLHWQNNWSMNSMSLSFVALTSRFCNDKDFYRIRSSLPIVSLQFCVQHRVGYKTMLILNFFVRNWKLLSN